MIYFSVRCGEIPLVSSRGYDRHVFHLNDPEKGSSVPVVQRDLPGTSVRLAADSLYVAAEIDQRAGHSVRAENIRDALRRIALRNPSEIDLHLIRKDDTPCFRVIFNFRRVD